MAASILDYYCRGFQPNTFDPSRCGSCLRPDYMHLNISPDKEAEQKLNAEVDDDASDLSEVITVSSDDISGGWTYEWSLGHSLSPEWELNICDTHIQPRCPGFWDNSPRTRSQNSERYIDDMTRFNPSPQRSTDSPCMDDRRGRNRSRRPSENCERERGFLSPDRRENSVRHTEENNKRQYRYFERGHPLPCNYVPEPKACVPFRTVNLGVPSQRRTSETFMQDIWRSESPQRYTYHSNFRKGTDSQTTSPSRHNSVSPVRRKLSETSVGHKRGSSLSRGQSRSHVTSQLPSHAPSKHSSRCSSPSRRRPSISQSATPLHNQTTNYTTQNGHYDAPNRNSRGSRTLSQSSHKHSLDSEKLYKNLESISHQSKQRSYEGSHSSTRTAVNSAVPTHTRNSRDVSPSRNGYGTRSNSPHKENGSRESMLSPLQGSWQGSSHSLLSNPASRGSSSSMRKTDIHMLAPEPVFHAADVPEVNRSYDRSRSSGRRGMDALLISESKKTAEIVEEVGMTIDDYIELADIPKIYLESEEEYVGLRKRNQSPSPCRNQRNKSERYTDETLVDSSRLDSDYRGRVRERGRDRREKCRDVESGQASRRQSVTSVHSQGSENLNGKHTFSRTRRCTASEPQTQAWLSFLDEHGKWRKHWFVLGESSVRYYRDSEAEESEDPEGEIDLRSCLDVSDCDVQKNYGFQLHTKKTVFTLSAMTSKIRRNWVKLLKQAIQNKSHQSETGSEKADPLSQRRSPCQPSSQFTEESRHKPAVHSHQDLSQREEGEGWDREQAKRLEERNKWFEEGLSFNEMCSRWDSMELKKGSVPIPVIDTIDTEVSRKWSELERLSFREMTAQFLIGNGTLHSNSQQISDSPNGSRTFEECANTSSTTNNYVSKHSSLTNGAQNSHSKADVFQKEPISLQKQVESIEKDHSALGVVVDSPCGPGAPCRAKLEAMVESHQRELQQLREKHDQEIRELKEEQENMLKEVNQASAKALEKLKAMHLEEMEKVKERSQGEERTVEPPQNVSQVYSLHSELDGLSGQYSQKGLELNYTGNTDLKNTERELEQLRRENQDLKNRLTEEISRMRHFITGQNSEPVGSNENYAQMETLLKAKEIEVLSLRREINSLQSEIRSLTRVKENAHDEVERD
ncbi:unnamed protein product [Knipowitschia caucasica]